MKENKMQSPLRKIRKRHLKTLEEIAGALGVTQPHLSRIENGQMKASPELAERLAKHFGYAITEIEILYPERFSNE